MDLSSDAMSNMGLTGYNMGATASNMRMRVRVISSEQHGCEDTQYNSGCLIMSGQLTTVCWLISVLDSWCPLAIELNCGAGPTPNSLLLAQQTSRQAGKPANQPSR